MDKKLNLENFNDFLFSAFKEQNPENLQKLYALEIQSAYGLKIQYMESVIDDLNNNKPYCENLSKVNNIDSNLDYLYEKYQKLQEEYPHLKDVLNDDGVEK